MGIQHLAKGTMNAFDTTDLYLACFLKASGHELRNVRRRGGRAVFTFANHDACWNAAIQFYSKRTTVETHAFATALRDLKVLAHEAPEEADDETDLSRRVRMLKSA